jgi:sulfur carrier protein ThiS
MKITVLTDSWARRYVPQETTELELPEGATPADVLKLMNIPEDEAGMTAVNGKAVSRTQPLAEGDKVKVFPVVIGG